MQIPRRYFMVVAGTLVASHAASIAMASIPQAIRIVVGYPPGGLTDIFARQLAAFAAPRLNQSIVVDNKPGAGTIIAAEHVAKQPADGNTLFLSLSSTLINNTALYRNLPYNPGKDFTFIAMLGIINAIVVVHKSVPASNLKDLVAYARSNRDLSFGSWASGSTGHILCAALNDAYRLSMIHVPYKGEAPAIQDLVGGQIQIAAASIGSVHPHLRSGALKAIGINGTQRSSVIPEAMTFLEQGATAPAFTTIGWVGLVGPAGMPRDAIERWTKIVRDFLELPDIQQRFNAYGIEPKFVANDDFFRIWQADMPVWAKLINDVGVKLD